MNKLISTFTGICLASGAFSGGQVWALEGSGHSGGGSGMLCFSSAGTKQQVQKVLRDNLANPDQQNDPFTDTVLSQISSVELLDLAEALVPNLGSVQYQLLKSNLSALDLIKDREVVLQAKAAAFSWRYLNRTAMRDMPFEEFHLDTGGVVQINDTAAKIIPNEKCLIAQIAVQSPIANSTHKKVDIDGRLFAKMDNINQAALILHEWIYKIALDRGQTDSSAARQAVAMAFDSTFATMGAHGIGDVFQTLGLTDEKPQEIYFGSAKIIDSQTISFQMLDKDGDTTRYGLILRDGDYNNVIKNRDGSVAYEFRMGDIVTHYDDQGITIQTSELEPRPFTSLGNTLNPYEISFGRDSLTFRSAEGMMWNGLPIRSSLRSDLEPLIFTSGMTMPHSFVAAKDFTYQGKKIPLDASVVLNDDGTIASVINH